MKALEANQVRPRTFSANQRLTKVDNMTRVPVGMKLTLNISRNIKPNSKRVQNVVISLFNTAAQTAKYIPSSLLKR